MSMVGMEGFEPSVSSSQTRRIEPDFPTLRRKPKRIIQHNVHPIGNRLCITED